MTAADGTGARAIGRPSGQADLGIGSMTVRGRGLSPATGQNLAAAVAAALAAQLPDRSARIDGITIRLPASIVGADGGIDRAALARAIARGRRAPDA